MKMGRGQITGVGMTVSMLTDALSRQPELADRQIVDQTGLKDTYDFTLRWTPDAPIPPGQEYPNAPPPDPNGPSIVAAIQEQLGLRLETIKGPVQFVVINNVEEPSPN
jgi:uncharacterized protein (TIGR03435 family)